MPTRGKNSNDVTPVAGDALAVYRAKRDGGRTPEPLGRLDVAGGSGIFVVHEHKATRHHFDLRLEIGGILQSWAIPKAPSQNPDDKRLAILVEEHPAEYANFEALIPPGNYGAGPMIVWDRGAFWPDLEPGQGLIDGEIKFRLRGYKLRGAFTLVRTKGKNRGDNEWLLIKKRDEFADPAPLPMASVLSGLLVDELAAGALRLQALRTTLAKAELPPMQTPFLQLRPMLCELSEPFSDDGWLFEIKYDGYRLMAEGGSGMARLQYRSGRDATAAFPEITAALRALPVPGLVLDGEVVVYGADGRPNFKALAERATTPTAAARARASVQAPVSYHVFDLLACDGFDVRNRSLRERKALAAAILPTLGPLRYEGHVEGAGARMFDQVGAIGLEGIVGKRADSTYLAGRSTAWRKIKHAHTGNFWVCGITPPEGTRTGFGALQLCVRDGDTFRYAGKVGSGFTEAKLRELAAHFAEAKAWRPPFALPDDSTGTRWIEPTTVVSVRYGDWADDGHLRFPVFVGLASAEDVAVAHVPDTDDHEPAPVPDAARAVAFTNRDKIYFPEAGLTKGDLLDYYAKVAPRMLPYLRDRPAVLTRYPDGISGKSFYQKNLPDWAPDWVATTRLWSDHSQREVHYVLIENVETLLFLVNLGSIPIHMWASRAADLGRPDWTILDLDPKGANPDDVTPIALAIHALCTELAVPHFVKTSGQSGFHILIPVAGSCTYEQARMLAYLLAHVVELQLPTIATTHKNPAQRHGRVYIDWGQNAHGQLLVAPYSARAVASGAVSWPVTWDEVAAGMTPQGITMRDADARLAMPDPMAPLLTTAIDLAGVLTRLGERAGV